MKTLEEKVEEIRKHNERAEKIQKEQMKKFCFKKEKEYLKTYLKEDPSIVGYFDYEKNIDIDYYVINNGKDEIKINKQEKKELNDVMWRYLCHE